MKSILATWLILFPILIGTECVRATPLTGNDNRNYMDESTSMNDTLVVKVGDEVFTATLFDNPTARAFKVLLPLKVTMTELNGNEKYFRLSRNLPADASDPGTIHSGDLMLWGSNTLVIFYETFSTSYNYTKLGKIDNPAGLKRALGTGNVTVRFELKK